MASVPSAGCLLAKNQFYRARLNSESSVCSSTSDSGLPTEPEKPHQGLPEFVEKCWWLKNFFHCEQVPVSTVRISISNERSHS
ncbi:pancreatic progenitor cell differentiation and proliferation factor-like protein [Hyperolius riggenbachi]|uniref:pancreatic progenitor cell differentiation and proliferation factor-like protein n=1 Tax=Hyperolius riggenbachi TaxID=752182 RepID=UPI0035A37F79